MNYKDQLKDPQWIKLRSLVIMRDKYKCKMCGRDNFLQVHHKEYINGLKAWEYKPCELITLCDICHSNVHKPLILARYRTKKIEATLVKNIIIDNFKEVCNG